MWGVRFPVRSSPGTRLLRDPCTRAMAVAGVRCESRLARCIPCARRHPQLATRSATTPMLRDPCTRQWRRRVRHASRVRWRRCAHAAQPLHKRRATPGQLSLDGAVWRRTLHGGTIACRARGAHTCRGPTGGEGAKLSRGNSSDDPVPNSRRPSSQLRCDYNVGFGTFKRMTQGALEGYSVMCTRLGCHKAGLGSRCADDNH